MRIIDLQPDQQQFIEQAAALLVDSFSENWPDAWPTLASARQEVLESLGAERLSRVAVDESGAVLGWIGAIRQYDGHVWELHPLVVRADRRRQGLGRALVTDLEEQVRRRGGLTLWLGTDDENNMTSLGGVELFPNVLEHAAAIHNYRGHPYEFYQKLGFVIIGVMPNANGPGKPDIYMAKPVVSDPSAVSEQCSVNSER
jgi:aminoglycoside 6'-N-acetyltransferase I